MFESDRAFRAKAERIEQTFLASLSALFFRNTSLITRVTTGGAEVIVLGFILWTVWNAWEAGERRLSRMLSRAYIKYISRLVVPRRPQAQSRRLGKVDAEERQMVTSPRLPRMLAPGRRGRAHK
jgi:K+ transporter